MLASYLEIIETFTNEIERLDKATEGHAGSLEETQFLMTILDVNY